MKKKQKNQYVSTRKKYSSMFKYFFRVLLIAFIPTLIIDVVLSIAFKGQHEWLIWLITFACLLIACIIGLVIENKMAKKMIEEENNRKKHKGKVVPSREDIDIFGE